MGDFDVKTKQMQDAEEIRREGRSRCRGMSFPKTKGT